MAPSRMEMTELVIIVSVGRGLVRTNAIRGCRPTSTREFDSSCSLQRAVDVAASLLLTVAAAAERSWTGFEISSSMFWDFVSLHQKPGVGGTRGRVLRDGSDGWRSPVPWGDNTGGRGRAHLSANHPVSVPPTGPVHRDGSFFPYIVTGSSVFWDFDSLHLEASRRPTGQLLRQRQTQRKTLRRPCRRLLRQRQAQQVRRSGVKELKLVLRMEFLSSIALRGVLGRVSSGSLHG